jgi:hypothetical protein
MRILDDCTSKKTLFIYLYLFNDAFTVTKTIQCSVALNGDE